MLEITTLGRIDVHGPSVQPARGGSCAILQQTKPLAVLMFLATAGRGRIARSQLLRWFWPGRDEARARNALSKTLGRIRDAVGPVVLADAREVSVVEGAIRTDIAAFDAAIGRGDVEAALALYEGDFLGHFTLPGLPDFEDWLDGMRVRLRRQAVELAVGRARRQAAAGDVAPAISVLERATMWEPSNESLARDLIARLAQSGDRARALAVYERLVHTLALQLDTSPDAETEVLVAAVRAHRPIVLADPASKAGAHLSEWPQAIAVLPFANLTGDAEQDYFADGMTEALITELARSSPCRVISRQSVLGYRGSRSSLQEIARTLDVDAVVEGSVMRDAAHVRVTAQLVRVEPEAHLWAGTFDRSVRDILVLHRDVACAIVDAIAAIANGSRGRSAERNGNIAGIDRARSHAKRARTVDPIAYEEYLKGRHFSLWPPQMERAIAHYHRAIERDPEHAQAWAGLAAAYANLTMFAYLSPADAFPQLRRATERALALDPQLGDALAMRGMYRMLADRDWTGAREDLTEAVERVPHGLDAQLALGLFLAAMGEFDAALDGLRTAATLDPIGATPRFAIAWCLYRARRYRASLDELDGILELHPHFALAYPYAAIASALLGDAEAARDAARQGIERLPDDHAALALGAAAFGSIGLPGEGRDALNRLIELGSRRYLDPWAVGIAHAGLGDIDAAAAWFRRMYDERSPSAFCVRHDPLLDPVREHPVFRDVLRRLAFPAPLAAGAATGRVDPGT